MKLPEEIQEAQTLIKQLIFQNDDKVPDILKDFLASRINLITLCITTYIFVKAYLTPQYSDIDPTMINFLSSFIVVFFSISVVFKMLTVISSFYYFPITFLATRRECTTNTYRKVHNFIRDKIGFNSSLLFCFLYTGIIFFTVSVCGVFLPFLSLAMPSLWSSILFFVISFKFPYAREEPNQFLDFALDKAHPNWSSYGDRGPKSENTQIADV